MKTYDDDDMLTPGEVAALFRVDAKTVTRWCAAGRIPRVDGRSSTIRTPGGHRRIRFKAIRLILSGELELARFGETAGADLPAVPVTRADARAWSDPGIYARNTGTL